MTPGDAVTLTPREAARQSLATGAAGIALLAIEQAMTGTGDWAKAHARIRTAATGVIDAATHTGLFYGAPAIAFMLHAAAADGSARYRSAAQDLDAHLVGLARRRLAVATARLRSGSTATAAEFDLLYGLTGVAALLLRCAPGGDELAEVLRYLIRLTEPRREDGRLLPGWWVPHDPDPLLPTPGGHANLGMAHGAAGILALLSLAALAGRAVDGQHEAIQRLACWFDHWRQDSPGGPWWPQWLILADLRTGRPCQPGPGRPSWCYGTVGIARALQLAALATADRARRAAAEEAMAAALTGRQLHRITDSGLCHGMAGVYQTAHRAARDAQTSAIERRLPAVAAALERHAAGRSGEDGLLTGNTGVRLALETMRRDAPPCSGWDACLLII